MRYIAPQYKPEPSTINRKAFVKGQAQAIEAGHATSKLAKDAEFYARKRNVNRSRKQGGKHGGGFILQIN